MLKMTTQEQSSYISKINESKGVCLTSDWERDSYQRALQIQQDRTQVVTALQRAKQDVEQLTANLNQLSGKYDALMEMLLLAEQRRRDESDRESEAAA